MTSYQSYHFAYKFAFMQAKENQDMCETILKIFEPEINEAVNNKINEKLKTAEEDKKQSLLDAAKKLIRAGVSDDILYSSFDREIVDLAKQK